MPILYRFTGLLALFLLIFVPACSLSSENEDTNVRYYEFTHRSDPSAYTFVARTSDPEVTARVENQLALPLEERNMHIHGDLARGDGGHNTNWSWHFIPGSWDLVEMSAEVCDGRPQMVEEDLDYWVDQVGYFCPWSSVVVREVQPE